MCSGRGVELPAAENLVRKRARCALALEVRNVVALETVHVAGRLDTRPLAIDLVEGLVPVRLVGAGLGPLTVAVAHRRAGEVRPAGNDGVESGRGAVARRRA